MMYTSTGINTSATISAKSGVTAATDFRGKAVKFDVNGDVIVANAAGEAVMGIGILTNDETTDKGQDVDIQIKEIGLGKAGAAIAKGAELATDANSKLVTAAAGQFVVATALQKAVAADEIIQIAITKYYKPATI